jgi:hypothetical protein
MSYKDKSTFEKFEKIKDSVSFRGFLLGEIQNARDYLKAEFVIMKLISLFCYFVLFYFILFYNFLNAHLKLSSLFSLKIKNKHINVFIIKK